jgi:hypothetical protein
MLLPVVNVPPLTPHASGVPLKLTVIIKKKMYTTVKARVGP